MDRDQADSLVYEITVASERYRYHSVFAVWLAHHLRDDECKMPIDKAIIDTNRTLAKLSNANG